VRLGRSNYISESGQKRPAALLNIGNKKADKMKDIIDVCCGGRMMWFQKNHESVIFQDIRQETFNYEGNRTVNIKPDIIADFRNMPYSDNTFNLAVMDPPHLKDIGKNTILAQKYGRLFPSWEDDIKQGITECYRILKPKGILVFKWNEEQIKVNRILDLIEWVPLFGHRTGSKSKTLWLLFRK
jgi:ubiquinone/menaquinone biosynthesis C-methylase UbiE